MSEDSLLKNKSFDLNSLDFENFGSWPISVKIVACVLVFITVMTVGYSMYVGSLQEDLDHEVRREYELREEFESKVGKSEHVEAYKQQLVDMNAMFKVMLGQLPTDTEVPGLLEDITYIGVGSGLEFNFINLQPEKANAFYIELPISISVRGDYHDLGGFVSGVVNLPRVVTLHDFLLTTPKDVTNGTLILQVLAKTYRYNDEGGK